MVTICATSGTSALLFNALLALLLLSILLLLNKISNDLKLHSVVEVIFISGMQRCNLPARLLKVAH